MCKRCARFIPCLLDPRFRGDGGRAGMPKGLNTGIRGDDGRAGMPKGLNTGIRGDGGRAGMTTKRWCARRTLRRKAIRRLVYPTLAIPAKAGIQWRIEGCVQRTLHIGWCARRTLRRKAVRRLVYPTLVIPAKPVHADLSRRSADARRRKRERANAGAKIPPPSFPRTCHAVAGTKSPRRRERESSRKS